MIISKRCYPVKEKQKTLNLKNKKFNLKRFKADYEDALKNDKPILK